MPTLVWTPEEDERLTELVNEFGEHKWSAIARALGSKSSKQCRRRWKNALTMEAKTTTWTPEEDERLIQFHKEMGNKWTAISQRFGDRTDNAAKNRWHALCKKHPELLGENAPLTTVGVKRGTRTRSLLDSTSTERDSVRMKSGGLNLRNSSSVSDHSGPSYMLPKTPFDQDSMLNQNQGVSPLEALLQKQGGNSLSGLPEGFSMPINPTDLSKLSKFSSLARAIEENGLHLRDMIQRDAPSANTLPSMDVSDSFQKFLASGIFNNGPATLPSSLPSQRMTFEDFANAMKSAATSKGFAFPSTQEPAIIGKDARQSSPSKLLENALSFTGQRADSLSSEQRELLEALLQSSKSMQLLDMPDGQKFAQARHMSSHLDTFNTMLSDFLNKQGQDDNDNSNE